MFNTNIIGNILPNHWEHSIELGHKISMQKGQLSFLFHILTNLVNGAGARQNTDCLGSNSFFFPAWPGRFLLFSSALNVLLNVLIAEFFYQF